MDLCNCRIPLSLLSALVVICTLNMSRPRTHLQIVASFSILKINARDRPEDFWEQLQYQPGTQPLCCRRNPYIHNGNHHCFHYKIHTIIFFTPAFPCNSDYTDDIAAGTQTTAFIERWFGLKS